MKKWFMCMAVLAVFFVSSCKTAPKKDENFLGDFDAVSLDPIMAAVVPRTKKVLSPRELSFVFAPRTNIVSFHHKYLGDNIWISLDYENRQQLIAAINTYLDAWQHKTLTAQNNKKKAYFGKTAAFMDWGLFGIVHKAKPVLRFEYQLIGEKQLPYFIIGNATTKELSKDAEQAANCPAVRIALSPAKCQEFLKILDQKTLLGIVADMQADFEEYEPNSEFDIQSSIDKEASETDESISPDEAEFEF